MMMGRQPRPQMVYMPPPPYQPVSFIFPLLFFFCIYVHKVLSFWMLRFSRSLSMCFNRTIHIIKDESNNPMVVMLSFCWEGCERTNPLFWFTFSPFCFSLFLSQLLELFSPFFKITGRIFISFKKNQKKKQKTIYL